MTSDVVTEYAESCLANERNDRIVFRKLRDSTNLLMAGGGRKATTSSAALPQTLLSNIRALFNVYTI